MVIPTQSIVKFLFNGITFLKKTLGPALFVIPVHRMIQNVDFMTPIENMIHDVVRDIVLDVINDPEIQTAVQNLIRDVILHCLQNAVQDAARDAVDDPKIKTPLKNKIHDAVDDPKIKTPFENKIHDAIVEGLRDGFRDASLEVFKVILDVSFVVGASYLVWKLIMNCLPKKSDPYLKKLNLELYAREQVIEMDIEIEEANPNEESRT